MDVDERARRELQARLQDVIGPEATDTLMEQLGSLGAQQVATRHDVQLGFSRVERDMAGLRSELKTDLAELRGEFAELRGDLERDMAELRSELKTDMAELRSEFAELGGEFADLRADMAGFQADITSEVAGLRVELSDRLSDVTRHLMVGVLSAMGLLSGITFGIARLV